MPRNLPRHLQNINHGWTSADDSVEFDIAHQPLLEIMNSSSSIELFGKIGKGLLQAMVVERLREIIIGAMFNGLYRGIDGVEPSHENHINARIPAQCLLQKGPPIHRRHLQITQNDSALAVTHIFKSLLGVGSSKAAIAEVRKGFPQHLHNGGLIIDYTNVHDCRRRVLVGGFRLSAYAHEEDLGKSCARRARTTVFGPVSCNER